jgi:DNA-binding MarR family transcriptional regulator
MATADRPVLDDAELRRVESAFLHIVKSVMNASHRAGGGLDRAAYVTLVYLERHGTVRLTELASLLSVDGSTVSRQVRNLEDLSLLQRTEDPADRRASVIALTDIGRDELNRQRAARWAGISYALAAMPQLRRERILDLFDELAGATEAPVEVRARAAR